MFHDSSKHINIRYHYMWDMVQRGVVGLHHISIDDQIADILTKPLPKGKFLVFREWLGLVDVTVPRRGHDLLRTLRYVLPHCILTSINWGGTKPWISWG